MKKLKLALAGGGLKSFSQIAVYEDIEKNNFQVEAVTGISMGAVVASLIAIGLKSHEVKQVMLDLENTILEKGLFRKISLKTINPFDNRIDGLVDSLELYAILKEKYTAFGIDKISDCKIPLCIGATDIQSGKLVLFTNRQDYFTNDVPTSFFYTESVDLASAVVASCGFPFVISSTTIGPHRLVDGGIVCNVLTTVFKRHRGDFVLASCCQQIDEDFDKQWPHDVGLRSIQLMMLHNDMYYAQQANEIINFDLSFDYIFQIGAGQEILDKSQQYLQANPIKYPIKKFIVL